MLLTGCDALSGIVSLGTHRPPAARDAGTRDASTNAPDSGWSDGGGDAAVSDTGPLGSDLVVSFLSDPPEAIEPGGAFDVEVTVENQGTLASTETTVRLELAAAGTLALAEPLIGSIGPGASESRRLHLTVPTSTAGAHRLRAVADPQRVVAELDEDNNVRLSGRVLVGALVVRPQSLDLTTPAGCIRSGLLSITNKSDRVAQLDAPMVQGSPEYRVSSRAPLDLGPGEAITATVTYAPIDPGADRATLWIAHDLGSPVAIALVADGDDGMRSETFHQFAERKVDLLFVVDDSCSMGEEQARLGQRFSAFLDFAATETIDYQVAVTTTDVGPGGPAGRFRGDPRIITPSTPSAALAFAANAMVGLDGSEAEQGLLAAERALSSPLIETDNAGFLRPEASLAVVYVSDEDDQSPGSVEAHAAFLGALRPAPFLRVSAIVGDAPAGCGTAAPGLRYLALVDLIGGAAASICESDWDQTLLALAAGGFGFQTRFELEGVPLASTIEVRVNGMVVPPPFWRYEAAARAIVFEPAAVPEASSEIEVGYRPGCGL